MIFAMLAFAFASCQQNGGSDLPKGEIEQSYVAISLASADMDARATSETEEAFDEGTTEERAVKSAYVFFYKDGAYFPVNSAANAAGGADDKNYLPIALDENGVEQTPATNVSDIKNKVLVLNNYKGEYPNQVVAVLNFDPESVADIHKKTIYELQETLVALGNDANGYVMTNSVYADATGEVVGTPLTSANIATSVEKASENPVTIYVERIAAKVVVNADIDNGLEDNVYKLNEGKINSVGEQVYAKILGWEVVNYTESYLYKDINAAWTDDELKIAGWNDKGNYRSYWATTQAATLPTVVLGDAADNGVNDLKAKYTGENTNTTGANVAKVVIKAQLKYEDGSVCEIAKWFGWEYAGVNALKIAVINNIASTYYYKEGETYTTIGTDDIVTVSGGEEGEPAKAYEVYFQLSSAGTAKTWYVRTTGGEFAAVADMNAELAKIQPALLYKDGLTYYHTPIVHRNSAAYGIVNGVVRNHVYQINIKSIAGYGTPIATGNLSVSPETPVEVSSYVSAEIKVLSWKTVEYDVDLK